MSKKIKDAQMEMQQGTRAGAGEPGQAVGGLLPPSGGADAQTGGMFPKLDTVSDAGLKARYAALVPPGGETRGERFDEELARLGRAGMMAAIRKAGTPLIGVYLPGKTICPQCACYLRVASSPRGPVRYHAICPQCKETVKTEKLRVIRTPRRRGEPR